MNPSVAILLVHGAFSLVVGGYQTPAWVAMPVHVFSDWESCNDAKSSLNRGPTTGFFCIDQDDFKRSPPAAIQVPVLVNPHEGG